MLGKLRESRRSDDPDPYRGAQHDVAIRVTGLLWMVGAAAMAAFSPFYPPTAQIGPIGWAVFAFLIALSLVFGYLALTLRFRPSWNQLYASSFNAIGQIAFQQWFAGGGHAPYIH